MNYFFLFIKKVCKYLSRKKKINNLFFDNKWLSDTWKRKKLFNK